MKQNATVSVEFSQPFIINVPTEGGMGDKEILELAKQEIIKQIQQKKNIPLKYGITQGKTLTLEEAHIGLIVKLKDEGEYGAICEVSPKNKFPIKVAVSAGKVVAVNPIAIEKASRKVKVEKVILGREKWQQEMGDWYMGSTGYFVNGDNVIPVVIGKQTKANHYVIPVSHEAKGTLYKLNSQLVSSRLFDTYKAAVDFKNRT